MLEGYLNGEKNELISITESEAIAKADFNSKHN